MTEPGAPNPHQWLPALLRTSAAMAVAAAAPAVMLAAALIPRTRRYLPTVAEMRTLLPGLHARTWWPWLAVVGCATGALIAIHPFPPDDLLRDMVAWSAHFDYRRMFWGSPRLPPYNQYIGFDLLAQYSRHLPAAWRALPFQLLPLLGLIGVMTATLHKTLRTHPDRRLLVAGLLLLTLMMPGVGTRIVQGRPEVDFAVWALSAGVIDLRLWWLVGVVMAPLYWLAPVYGAAALLCTRHTWRQRIAFGVAYGIVAAALWMLLSHGTWWTGFTALLASGRARIGHVAEDGSVLGLLAGTGAALWVMAAAYWRRGFRRHDDLDLWWTLVVFLLPDMMRYTDLLSPLLVLLLARAMARQERFVPLAAARIAVVWTAIFLLPRAFGGLPAPAAGFLADVQPGDRVLAPFSFVLYRAIYAGAPRGAVFAPAMEVGMTHRDVQRMAMKLAQGQLSCAALERHKVRWVVEDHMKGSIPPCLALDSVDGALRAWRVVRTTGAES